MVFLHHNRLLWTPVSDFDKGREEKKIGDSMPRHFPEEMAEAKIRVEGKN